MVVKPNQPVDEFADVGYFCVDFGRKFDERRFFVPDSDVVQVGGQVSVPLRRLRAEVSGLWLFGVAVIVDDVDDFSIVDLVLGLGGVGLGLVEGCFWRRSGGR